MSITQKAEPYTDFTQNHLPRLLGYVLPIAHKDQFGQESIGSGVLVRIGQKHLIATAKHCILHCPRVLRDDFYLLRGEVVCRRPHPILRTGLDPTLDLGYLEVDAHDLPEVQVHQLSTDRIVSGIVHIVGHPVCEIERNAARREICLSRTSFGTELEAETDDFLRFSYPVTGYSYDEARREWVTGNFPLTPHGFSGGGCFGVTKTTAGGLEIVEDRLLGIQHSWSTRGRSVKAAPTSRLLELLKSTGVLVQ